jgi:pimeloyl-ACP methyl ester carboxylesterase
MAYLEIQTKKVYYEVHGNSDQVLVILNGIMMSCASWQPFLGMLTKHIKVVLVDFFDQGKSDYLETNYSQDVQVELVRELLKALDLKHVTLLGISYGGEVAMKYTVQYGDSLSKLILANTTAYTDSQLKAVGESWINAAKSYDGIQFFKATIPPIYSSDFYERSSEWLGARQRLFDKVFNEKWYEGFIRLVLSAESHDERLKICQIHVPTLIIGADQDGITPLSRQEHLNACIPNSRFLVIQNCGHASMYERPIEFFAAVLGFMMTADETFTL